MSISVRRATAMDAAAYSRIMGDPGVYPGLMQLPYTCEEIWRARLTEANSPGKVDLLLVAEMDASVAGSAGVHLAHASARRRHAWKLGISVLPQAQGQGVGTALMAAICDYADGWLGALRLELDVYTDNTRALALYRKFGFAIEGTHRGYALRDGVFVDSYSMARFHPRPPCITNA